MEHCESVTHSQTYMNEKAYAAFKKFEAMVKFGENVTELHWMKSSFALIQLHAVQMK